MREIVLHVNTRFALDFGITSLAVKFWEYKGAHFGLNLSRLGYCISAKCVQL